MKNNRTYMDIGSILDEVFEAAKDFGAKMGKEFGLPLRRPAISTRAQRHRNESRQSAEGLAAHPQG